MGDRKEQGVFSYHLSPITSYFFPSPAHEMNDLDLIALTDAGLLPVGAADDSLVQLNGEAFGRKREMIDEFGKCDRICHVPRFAVDLDQQVFDLPSNHQAWWMTRRSSALCSLLTALTRMAARPEVKYGSIA